ncbi:DoxX family protein [Virgibacillus salexigens]|uniref:DoxX family protein n=1 Tax=Virgibacillus salexigens TaxID=61016 RepID=UPI00190C8CB4|nr:DoxX family protein [Virgibacillus salexigens]
MNKWRKYAGWVGLILMALIFILAGALKLMGVQVMVEIFDRLGYPAWFRIAIGVLEIVGAFALPIRHTSRYAAFLLALIMIGAITSTIINGQIVNVVLPVVLLFFLIWIAVVGKSVKYHKLNKETMTS